MKSIKLNLLGPLVLSSVLFILIGCSDNKGETSTTEPEATVEKTDSAHQEVLDSVQAEETKEIAKTASSSQVLATVASVLVDAKGGSVDAAEIGKAPYLLFYYSAHWCPPCRIFTPKLVEFYNANGGGEKFEIVFVSSDRSEEAMYGYMEEENMPWSAIKYDAIGSTGIKDHGGPYIPSLVMFDSEGNLVIGTDYDGGVEPDAVLEKLTQSI